MSGVIHADQPKDSEDEVIKAEEKMAEMELASLISAEYAAVGLPQSIPSEILLGTLRDGRLRVISPIRVKVIREGDHFILEAIELNEFGFGDNLSEATVDLQHTIAELYLTLVADEEHLGSELHETLESLKRIIKKKSE